jgi:predicted enzyme related to lactoylglutathione lyase
LTDTDIDILFAGVPVAQFDAAVSWYTQLFGRSADVVVDVDELMWRFADAAWLYVVCDAKRAGRALVALCVDDLDKTVQDISGRGITGDPIQIVGNSGRKATFTDADGNAISFIQVTTSGS